MNVIYERCCGIDVHKKMIMACIIVKGKKEIRGFGTMTDDLIELIAWIKETNCQVVAMESTGVYWKPVYNLLESEGISVIIVNAQHIKGVPGRKTDVKDCEWICDLVRHGLVKASFIPSREQRELREITRYRQDLIEERAREINRIQAVLEGANIKLSSVITDVNGKTGQNILQAISKGTTDSSKLSELACGSVKAKQYDLKRALTGSIGTHQQKMIEHQLNHIVFLNQEIEHLGEDIKKKPSLQENR